MQCVGQPGQGSQVDASLCVQNNVPCQSQTFPCTICPANVQAQQQIAVQPQPVQVQTQFQNYPGWTVDANGQYTAIPGWTGGRRRSVGAAKPEVSSVSVNVVALSVSGGLIVLVALFASSGRTVRHMVHKRVEEALASSAAVN